MPAAPSLPGLPLPPPSRGAEKGSWAEFSIVQRLPEIGRRILAENDFPAAAVARLEALIAEIPAGPLRPLDLPLAPYLEDWQRYLQPYLGQDWLNPPWFFVEHYFYQRVLEAVGYYHPGPGRGVDPFALQKRLGLEANRAMIHGLAERLSHKPESRSSLRESLSLLLSADLWGNQIDLSIWPAANGEGAQGGLLPRPRQANLLVDDAPRAMDYLLDLPDGSARVDFLLDNAGFELVADLALADFLLAAGLTRSVRFHAKLHPTYVSDATEADVRATIAALSAEEHPATRALGQRLQMALSDNRLVLRSHPFWTSPLDMWDMPAELRREFGASTLVISKGDMNYRRLLGDRHWPFETPFADLLGYFPAPLLALRTLKSELIVGLARGEAEKIAQSDPHWLTDGQWGVIQFFTATTTSAS
jgi:uncharacterized protein with ATP-grasp and redox domains